MTEEERVLALIPANILLTGADAISPSKIAQAFGWSEDKAMKVIHKLVMDNKIIPCMAYKKA